jgi:cytoskeletal protein CcmA (bactofilin family)
MATKTKHSLPAPEAGADVATLVAAGTHVVGRLSGHEDIRVQGTVEGYIRLDTTLYVEPEGVLLAEVYARDVVVSGTVVGNVTAEHAIVLTASARVVGDLKAPRVSVAPGAAFRGAVATEAPAAEELTMEAAARNYTAGRAPAARSAISERTNVAVQGNGATKSARQAVRLPPRRAQAFTAAAPRVHPAPAAAPTPAPITPPMRPTTRPEDDTIVVHHPALRRSDPSPRQEVRPRALTRGKHKVERVD